MELDYSVKPSVFQRLRPKLQNWRLLAFFGFFLLLFGSLGYKIFNEVLSNGIHDYGSYAEVNLKALGQFPFDGQNGLLTDIPARFRELDGRKVELQGFMYPTMDSSRRVRECQLVWNISKCCFGGPPLVQERVFLNAPPGRTMELYDPYTFVRVIGTLHVRIERNSEGAITSVYKMVVDQTGAV